MSRYLFGPTLLGVVGLLFGLQVGEALFGLNRATALVPAVCAGLVFGITCLVCEFRRKPTLREQQEIFVSDESYQE